jgi:hypothetical protein
MIGGLPDVTALALAQQLVLAVGILMGGTLLAACANFPEFWDQDRQRGGPITASVYGLAPILIWIALALSWLSGTCFAKAVNPSFRRARTPVGSAVNPQRRFLIDRYIAAVDQGGVISTGHVAMSLSPDVYVSLVPADDMDHSPDEFGRILRAGSENDVPGRFRPSFEEECVTWRAPDREIVFSRYNSAAVRAFLEIYHRADLQPHQSQLFVDRRLVSGCGCRRRSWSRAALEASLSAADGSGYVAACPLAGPG